MRTNLLMTLLLALPTVSPASDYLMYIGAGGEPAGQETTLFDGSIQNIATDVKNSPRLKVDLALNGRDSKTEAIIQGSFPAVESKSDFRAAGHERLIENYRKKLENNKIVAGDQMLIYIDSHGSKNSANTKSHYIAISDGSTTNLDTLAGATVVGLDCLEVLKSLAKVKGVKIAIVESTTPLLWPMTTLV